MDVEINKSWKLAFAILALIFNAVMIVYLTIYGKPENLLHQNALSWSYITSAAVLAGIGFSAITSLLPAVFTPKKAT